MKPFEKTCPLTQTELVNEYFMDYRAQVLAIAAFLDRMDRASEQDIGDDFRFRSFQITRPRGRRPRPVLGLHR